MVWLRSQCNIIVGLPPTEKPSSTLRTILNKLLKSIKRRRPAYTEASSEIWQSEERHALAPGAPLILLQSLRILDPLPSQPLGGMGRRPVATRYSNELVRA